MKKIKKNNLRSILEEQPFFAMLSFYSVHGPVQTRKALWEKYRQAALAIDHQGDRFSIDRTLPVRQVQDHPIYAGMVETVDDAVGVVLDALEAKQLTDNTIVIFTSDNGGVSSGDAFCTSNLPFRGGKGRQWEGGIREPFYIKWPGSQSQGKVSNTPVMPSTALRSANAEATAPRLRLPLNNGIETPAVNAVSSVSSKRLTPNCQPISTRLCA